MADFISPPIDTDPADLTVEAFAYLESVIPGFDANVPDLTTWTIEAVARIVALLMSLASNVPAAIFRYFGPLVGVTPIDAASATITSTWTMIDSLGHFVPAGSVVNLSATDGSVVQFQTIADFTVAAASTSTGTGAVTLVAINSGAAGNGLTGTVEVASELPFVASVTLVGATTGGADAESDDVYLARLRTRLQLLSPRPILPNDFAILYQDIPEVASAVAIDGYNPTDSSYGNERTVAVAGRKADGTTISAPGKAAGEAYLESMREVNFIVHAIDATYHPTDVTVVAVAYADWDTTDVQTRTAAAISDYLSPATWGTPNFGEGATWLLETKVRYLEVAEIVNRVDGLHYISTLTVNGGTSDVTLTGAAPLPQPGTISVTVNTP